MLNVTVDNHTYNFQQKFSDYDLKKKKNIENNSLLLNFIQSYLLYFFCLRTIINENNFYLINKSLEKKLY